MAKQKKEEKIEEAVDDDIRHIVRIAGKDLDGKLPLPRALTGIKGVGTNLADAIAVKASQELHINKMEKVGHLSEEQTEKIEKIVLDPLKHGIPLWMVNRRKDYATGEDLHMTSHELDFKIKEDKDKEKKARSYKGVRYSLGLTVRGQRTKTSGRKGTTVGVQRRKDAKGSGK